MNDINIMLITNVKQIIFLEIDINILLIRRKIMIKKDLLLYKKALLVVDMLNGFVNEGPLHDKRCQEIVPRQKELIEEALKQEDLVVFIKDNHDKNATEFLRMPAHCIENTSESELIPELKIYEGKENTISIKKNSTSFNEVPAFRNLMHDLVNLERVDEIGVCTDICDFNGIMGLANYFDQENRKVSLYVHEDAIKTYAEEERKEYVEASKLLLTQQGIHLVRK